MMPRACIGLSAVIGFQNIENQYILKTIGRYTPQQQLTLNPKSQFHYKSAQTLRRSQPQLNTQQQ